LTDVDQQKIDEYKELIKKEGSRKALNIITKAGISYNENFTEMHRLDPIFSNKYQQARTTLPSDIQIVYDPRRLDGNIYESVFNKLNVEPEKKLFTNSIFNLIQCYVVDDDSELLDEAVTDAGLNAIVSNPQLTFNR